MKRYTEIVLKAGEGITFGVEERGSETLIISARKIDTADDKSANSANLLIPTDDDNSANSAKLPIPIADGNSANYANPPIPEGYKYVCGEWNNGFVIERCSDESQFVWIPVGSLKPNGTLDGKHFSKKFGTRNYINGQFPSSMNVTRFKYVVKRKCGSIEKYGGFYISRYNISIKPGEKIQSVKGVRPMYIRPSKSNNWDEQAKRLIMLASNFENNPAFDSYLTGAQEYDSILEWFIETSRTLPEIAKDSTGWGNFLNADKTNGKVMRTGSREEWCTNNIYDFAGNVGELTTEIDEWGSHIVRGGGCANKGDELPVAYRNYYIPGNDFTIGFRVALFIR